MTYPLFPLFFLAIGFGVFHGFAKFAADDAPVVWRLLVISKHGFDHRARNHRARIKDTGRTKPERT